MTVARCRGWQEQRLPLYEARPCPHRGLADYSYATICQGCIDDELDWLERQEEARDRAAYADAPVAEVEGWGR